MLKQPAQNIERRETVVKHQKSSVISVSQISALALELSRQVDGTIGPTFEQNCELAFQILAKYQAILNKMQEEISD